MQKDTDHRGNETVFVNNFGCVSDYSEERKRIIHLVRQLRELKQGKITNWEDAAEWHIKYSNLNGESVLALTITLSPAGCEWARKGGCTMCGEFEGADKRNTLVENPQFHIAQFASAIGNPKIWEVIRKEGRPVTWLRINQEGNYTNPHEMNYRAQETILRLAMRINGVKRITIESRPQYLNKATVKSLSRLFEGSAVELEVGMGIEAENEVVRNVCINKQGNKQQFTNSAKLLMEYNIQPLAYVLLKPPFLTEREAIEEAVVTAHFAVNIGFTRISLEPMSIHRYSLVEALANTGDYKVPWLWSAVEVTKRCSDIAKLFGIGGIGYYPIPSIYAHNRCCDREENCNCKCSEAIIEYGKSRDVRVFDVLACNCKSIWERECGCEGLSLKRRIQDQLTRVESLIPSYYSEEREGNMVFRNQRILASGSQ